MAVNRLHTPASVPLSAGALEFTDRFESFESQQTETRRGGDAATFTPTGYESGYAYPLIVWLHAAGSCPRELPEVMRHVSLRNYLAVAPRGLERSDGEGCDWRQTADGVEAAEAAVSEAMETACDLFNVHPRRVFVAGVGGGGTMALRLGLQRPEWFSGAISIDGPLPRGGCPLSRVNDSRGVPLLLSSSRFSAGYPQPTLCADLALLHSAGFHVAVRQYPGDDGVTTAMLSDVNRWVMDLVCG